MLREMSSLEELDSYIFQSALRIFGTVIVPHPSVSLPAQCLGNCSESSDIRNRRSNPAESRTGPSKGNHLHEGTDLPG